jgi:hypothetical protein
MIVALISSNSLFLMVLVGCLVIDSPADPLPERSSTILAYLCVVYYYYCYETTGNTNASTLLFTTVPGTLLVVWRIDSIYIYRRAWILQNDEHCIMKCRYSFSKGKRKCVISSIA